MMDFVEIENIINSIENIQKGEFITSSTQPQNQNTGAIWFISNDENKVSGYKIKQENGYSDMYYLGASSENINYNNYNLEQIFSSFSPKVCKCTSNSYDTIKIVEVEDSYIIRPGSKLFIDFIESTAISDFKIQIKNSSVLFEDYLYENKTEKFVNYTPNTLYKFVYIDNKFIQYDSTGSIATNKKPGTIISSEDFTVDFKGSVSVKNSEKTNCDKNGNKLEDTYAPAIHDNEYAIYGGGTSKKYGHIKLSDNYEYIQGKADNALGASQDNIYQTYKKMDENRNVEDKVVFNYNLITNGDFLINSKNYEEYNTPGEAYDCWIVDGKAQVSKNDEGLVIYCKEGGFDREYEEDIDSELYQVIYDIEGSNQSKFILSGEVKYSGRVQVLDSFDNRKIIDKEIIQELNENSENNDIQYFCYELDFSTLKGNPIIKFVSYEKLTILWVQLEQNKQTRHCVEPISLQAQRCYGYGKDQSYFLMRDNNIVLNPDFKINRGELTEYNSLENNSIITVDLWELYSKGSVIPLKRGVRVADTENNSTLSQYLTNPQYFVGKTLTFYCNGLGNEGKYKILIIPYQEDEIIENEDGTQTIKERPLEGFSKSSDYTSDNILMSYTVPEGTIYLKISFCFNIEDGGYVDLFYIKGEIGNNYTGFEARPYAQDYSYIIPYSVDSNGKKMGVISTGHVNNGKNLLINSNFQINQRRKDNYECVNLTSAFGVDRWRMTLNTKQTVKKDNKGNVTSILVESPVGNKGNAIRQFIDNPIWYIGKTLTFSCKVKNPSSTITISIGLDDENKSEEIALSNENMIDTDIYAVSYDIPFDAQPIFLYVEFMFHDDINNESVEIVWTKLELGDSNTEYIPNLYYKEYNDCLYFYQEFEILQDQNVISNINTRYIDGKILRQFNFLKGMRCIPDVYLKHGYYDMSYQAYDKKATSSSSYSCSISEVSNIGNHFYGEFIIYDICDSNVKIINSSFGLIPHCPSATSSYVGYNYYKNENEYVTINDLPSFKTYSNAQNTSLTNTIAEELKYINNQTVFRDYSTMDNASYQLDSMYPFDYSGTFWREDLVFKIDGEIYYTIENKEE